MGALLLGLLSSQLLFYYLILLANVNIHQYHSLFYHRKCFQLNRKMIGEMSLEKQLSTETQFFRMMFLWLFYSSQSITLSWWAENPRILIHCYDPYSQYLLHISSQRGERAQWKNQNVPTVHLTTNRQIFYCPLTW